MSSHPERGFSFVEAMVASLLVGVALVALAQLVTLSGVQTGSSRHAAQALTVAQAKLEELRTRAWHFRPDGVRVSSGELAPSPPSSLTDDADGFFATLDRFGEPTTGSPHYRLRWAVSAFDPSDPDTLVLKVCAFSPGRVAPSAAADACVWTIRTRKL